MKTSTTLLVVLASVIFIAWLVSNLNASCSDLSKVPQDQMDKATFEYYMVNCQ